MKYICLIYGDETNAASKPPEGSQAQKEMMEGYFAFGGEAGGAGVLLGGDALEDTATATTVRVKDGETITTDGPFAETKEQLGGFYLLDVPDLDTAIEWAAKIPHAAVGSIEVRPVMVFDA